MWGKIIIPMYRLWLNGLYGLYGPRCPLSAKRPINLISLSFTHGALLLTCPKHALTLMPSWINYHIQYTMSNKVTYPLENFTVATVEACPASIATLAQRWPNVNPYVGPTSAHQRWANVDLSIGPTLAQRWRANVGPTLCQHRPNVGTLTLGQRWHNVASMVVYQRCTNIGLTEAALLAFCEGNPSGQERWRWCLPKQPVEQTVELSNRWFEKTMWSTSM